MTVEKAGDTAARSVCRHSRARHQIPLDIRMARRHGLGRRRAQTAAAAGAHSARAAVSCDPESGCVMRHDGHARLLVTPGDALSRLVGDSPKFRFALERLPLIAQSDATVVVS